jgi:hypothetical protein
MWSGDVFSELGEIVQAFSERKVLSIVGGTSTLRADVWSFIDGTSSKSAAFHRLCALTLIWLKKNEVLGKVNV